MEVTLTSFLPRWNPLKCASFFYHTNESGTLENPKNVTILHKMSKWRSFWPPFLYLGNLDMNQVFKTQKMRPHLTMMRLTSKLPNWRSLWPPFSYLDEIQWSVYHFSSYIWIRHPWKSLKWFYIAPYRQNVKMEVILTSLFIPKWPPVQCTSFFNLD